MLSFCSFSVLKNQCLAEATCGTKRCAELFKFLLKNVASYKKGNAADCIVQQQFPKCKGLRVTTDKATGDHELTVRASYQLHSRSTELFTTQRPFTTKA